MAHQTIKQRSLDYEPEPIEFLHGRLIELFHDFRRGKTDSATVDICGTEFNDIIAKAKLETYSKYKKN